MCIISSSVFCVQILYNGKVFAFNLYFYIGYSRVCLQVILFACIQHGARYMGTLSFAFWNFLGFFPKYFLSALVESVDANLMDTEGLLYFFSYLIDLTRIFSIFNILNSSSKSRPPCLIPEIIGIFYFSSVNILTLGFS